MGYNKITNLLGKLDKDEISKFTTIKWTEIFDQSNGTYNPNKVIRFKTPQIKDNLCDFDDAYIVATGKVTVANRGNNLDEYNIKFYLKNSAPFSNCVLEINNQLIEDAQDLEIVMLIFNLLYCSKNFRKTTGSFWNYYPDKSSSGYDHEYNETQRIFHSIKDSESFNYKTKLVDTLLGVNDPANGNDVERELENIKFVVPLKKLRNFFFSLNFLMVKQKLN